VYAEQMLVDHPDLDRDQLASDAIAAGELQERALLA